MNGVKADLDKQRTEGIVRLLLISRPALLQLQVVLDYPHNIITESLLKQCDTSS